MIGMVEILERKLKSSRNVLSLGIYHQNLQRTSTILVFCKRYSENQHISLKDHQGKKERWASWINQFIRC